MPLPTTPVVNDLNPERLRAVIASPGGYGKTELAAGWFPQTTLHLDLEGGTRFLSTPGFRHEIPTYDAFTATVNELCAGGHQYKAVIIDTADELIRLADQAAGQRHGKVAAGIVDYGKGLADRDGTIFRELGKLRATDLGIILLTHSINTTIKGEGAERVVTYPRIESGQEGDRLRKPLIGWFDYVFHVDKVSEAERVLITGGNPRYETKRRYSLPDRLPLPKGQGANALYAALVAGAQQHQAETQAVAA
jgi:hypothetical protein